jgi:type IV secretion system protein VirB4
MMTLTEHQPLKRRLATSEVPASDFVPYACHYDDHTLLTKSGQMIQIIRLEGLPYESADPEALDHGKRMLNALFKSIATPGYALWFHTLRGRQDTYPLGDLTKGFASSLNDRWHAKHKPFFRNTLYLSIVKQAFQVRGLGSFFRDCVSRPSENELASQCRTLTETTHRFLSTLSDYSPRLLTVRETSYGRISEPLGFLGRLLNLEARPVLLPHTDISHILPTKRLFFGDNAIECRGMQGSVFAAIVSIKEYGPETRAGLLDGLLNLPFEFVLTQSFVFSHRQSALQTLQLQQRRMEQVEDLSHSQIDEIDDALDDATAGRIAFGEHHLTLQPIASSLQALKETLAQIETTFMNVGLLAVREDLNLEAAFWAQLPGNAHYIARRSVVHTMNIAGLASLHNMPSGQADGNLWGPAVTVFETPSKTPFFFNFHVQDVGHTLVIGPTGSGKTALLNFLCAQAQKFKGRLFYFDRDRGAEIFLRALRGRYIRFSSGLSSGLNPLQLPDTPSNRAFLAEWLKGLLTAFGDAFTPDDASRVASAVAGNFRLLPAQRTLENIAPFLGTVGTGRLAARLAPWHGKGLKASVFGGEKDRLDLDQPVMGFDMGELLRDAHALAPVLFYLFHRIASVLDGTPTLVVLDEAWALLKDPVFATKIEEWLKTFRKMNASIVFATQNVEDAISSSISPTLIEQTATQIFFPNPKATEAYQAAFKVTNRELSLVRDMAGRRRPFLIKQGKTSLIAELDLTGFPELSVLSGRTETVLRLDALRSRVGDDPEQWLPLFLEESRA